jgi:hypothetical protein
MKTTMFKIAAMMLFLTIGACSCTKWIDKKINEKLEKERTTLPPETQTGKNTFGCYVNGELFVRERGSAGFGMSSLRAEYFQTTKILSIMASSNKGSIGLRVSNPSVNGYKELSWIKYVKGNYDKTFNGHNLGEITLTRFDTVNGIVSGTFACEIPYHDEQNGKDSVIQITQGRFDIRWLEMED